MIAPVRVIYIGGCGRSGTTLLGRMLDSQPGVVAIGELFLLGRPGLAGNRICGCGAPVDTCPFWTDVVDRAFASDGARTMTEMDRLRARVDRNRHIPRLLLPVLAPRVRRDQRRYEALLSELYRVITDVAGCDVVVDSSKHASTAFLLRRLPVDLHVVHLVRDSRGVAYSWTKRVPQPALGRSGALMERASPARTALRWLLYNTLFALLARLGQSATRVRYEDLVRCPRRELGRILDDAGVPRRSEADAQHPSAVVHLRPSHMVAGNPMRFRSGPVAMTLDEEWRDRLPRSSRRLVTLLTAPMLATYGYLGPT